VLPQLLGTPTPLREIVTGTGAALAPQRGGGGFLLASGRGI